MTNTEHDLLAAIGTLARQGTMPCTAYEAARWMQTTTGARFLISAGALFRALEHLEDQGVLRGTWENARIAAREGRPQRRFYWTTEEIA